MSPIDQAIHRLHAAHTRNATLAGAALVNAANSAVGLAARHGGRLIAADNTGERILGAALALHAGASESVNSSQRLDGQVLMLISGAVAGPMSLTQTVARLRSLGAARVHLGVLDGWGAQVPGCDTVETLSADHSQAKRSTRTSRGRHSAA